MGILDLIYPKNCLKCGLPGSYFCSSCLKKLNKPKRVCPVCLKFSPTGKAHPGCKTELGIDGMVSLWSYEGIIRKAILTLKYRFATDTLKEFSEIIAKELKKENLAFLKNSIFVPVPLHKQRERERGFNQVREILKCLCLNLDLVMVDDIVGRKRNTESQTKLGKSERRENVKNAFSFNSRYEIKDGNRTFVVFDDVLTTGSTVKEITRVLKENGAGRVWVITIAKGSL